MISTIDRLLSLHVSDCMTCAVHTISGNQTLEEAAALLSSLDLSGAPVVDELGHCVGMLSATDFVRELSEGSQRDMGLPGPVEPVLSGEQVQPLDAEAAGLHRVHRHMSTRVHTIAEDAPLIEAARMMCAEHLHRLPVVDEKGHMLGLISSLDIVATMVKAVEE